MSPGYTPGCTIWSVRVAHPQLGFESLPAVDLLLLLSTVSITV